MMIIYVSVRPGIDAAEIQELPGALSISRDLPFIRSRPRTSFLSRSVVPRS